MKSDAVYVKIKENYGRVVKMVVKKGNKRLSYTLSVDLYEKLKNEADKVGLTKSAMTTTIVSKYLYQKLELEPAFIKEMSEKVSKLMVKTAEKIRED